MPEADPHQSLEETFDRIEETILPNLSMMLDALLEAASQARAGADSEAYAAELRALALELETLTRQVEAVSPAQLGLRQFRSASNA